MDSTWIVRLDAPGDGPRLAVKDCIDVAGLPTTAGCQAVAERALPAERDAPVVAAARRAGARIVGKTNLTELCWSASGVNSWSGTPVNPAAPDRLPGGSSSGSAVAVARGEADTALGTDTAGSVRIPAACCGVAGLKTTWGRIPLDGVYPLGPSLDTVGPLGADVAAVELGLRLIDPGYTAVSGEPARQAGRIRAEADPAADAAVDAALAAAGLRLTDVDPFDLQAANQATNVLIDVEAYQANYYMLEFADELTPQIQANMAESGQVKPDEVTAANQVRQQVRDWFSGQLERHPFLVMPTLMGPPAILGQRGTSLTRLTGPANLTGLPALALPVPVPAGADWPAGLPASLQLIGPAGSEEQLLALGRVIETALGGWRTGTR
jgi:amidase